MVLNKTYSRLQLLHSIRNCFLLKTKFYDFSIITVSIFLILISSIPLCRAETCSIPPCTITGNAQFKTNWVFYWLPDNPQTIGRSSEATVGVFGGYPPFTWTVNGNGFSLAEEETSERNNVLISSSTACGAASINVTDTKGYMTTGSLRCSAGKWSGVKPGCVFGGVDEYVYEGGATYTPSNWPLWTYTVGKYFQSQSIGRTDIPCGQSCTNCADQCAQKAAESAQYQCSPCLGRTSNVPCRRIQVLGQCCTFYNVTYKEWVCE